MKEQKALRAAKRHPALSAFAPARLFYACNQIGNGKKRLLTKRPDFQISD
jgi:hypothetical protein